MRGKDTHIKVQKEVKRKINQHEDVRVLVFRCFTDGMGWDGMGWDTVRGELRGLSTNAAREHHIFRPKRDAFRVDRSEVRVFKNTHNVRLSSFLDRQDGRRLETQIGTVRGRNLANQTLEWRFANKQLGGFLVLADLTKSDCARPVPVRLLDAALGQGKRLGAERGPHTSNRLACDLLDARHLVAGLTKTQTEHHTYHAHQPVLKGNFIFSCFLF